MFPLCSKSGGRHVEGFRGGGGGAGVDRALCRDDRDVGASYSATVGVWARFGVRALGGSTPARTTPSRLGWGKAGWRRAGVFTRVDFDLSQAPRWMESESAARPLFSPRKPRECR